MKRQNKSANSPSKTPPTLQVKTLYLLIFNTMTWYFLMPLCMVIYVGAKHLLALRNKVDTSKVGEPSFLMVVTGGQFAYRRADGVFVVPIGCLKD